MAICDNTSEEISHGVELAIGKGAAGEYTCGMLIIGADDDVKPRLDLGEKIRELCEALLQDESVIDARNRVERFLQNPEATRGYAALANLGETLHQKQHAGEEISEEEADRFEAMRRDVLGDPAVQAFAEARNTLQEIEGMITAYVGRTLELGRVPAESDFASQGGSCGSGCGCH